MQATFENFLDKLSGLSEADVHDAADFDWPDQLDDGWCFTPELVSLYGTPAWDQLDEAGRKRLAFCEAVNFFSLNVHGERYLISELCQRLYDGGSQSLSRYLNHFVAEESRHMMFFAGFCDRYADGLYPDRTVAASTEVDDPALSTLLLFARISVFEEIVDHYNSKMARDERLLPVVREIHRIHHVEELRHLAFGRRYLAETLEEVVAGDPVVLAKIREHLAAYVDFTWRQYYSFDAYQAAGLDNSVLLWRDALNSKHARAHRNAVNRKRLGTLRRIGLLEDTA